MGHETVAPFSKGPQASDLGHFFGEKWVAVVTVMTQRRTKGMIVISRLGVKL